MKIVMYHKSHNAVGQYRMWIPAKYLNREAGWQVKTYPPWQTLTHVLQTPIEHASMQADMDWADLAVWQWYWQPGEVLAAEKLRSITGTPIIMDLDDDVLHVPAEHMAYDGFKSRTPEECQQVLPIPVEALTVMQRRGWQVGLQPDGTVVAGRQIGFDFPEVFKRILTHVDGLLVSTPYLRDTYHPLLAPGAGCWDAPNCYDPDEWANVQPAPERSTPTIVWAGSNAHSANVAVAFPALKRLCKRYPDLRILVLGAELPRWRELSPHVEFLSWVGLDGYPTALASLGAWAGIAPATAEPFNFAKSHIRWMEYSLAGIPTVASPMPEMTQWAKDACLFAVSDFAWEEHLTKLLESATLRDAVRQQAGEAVRARCNIVNNLDPWIRAFKAAHQQGVIVRGLPEHQRGLASADVPLSEGVEQQPPVLA